MGIKTLLPFVKNACREANILEFKGHSVAVDVSCLLHRGLFGSMEEFANGKDSKLYIYYIKKHITALLDIGCHVIMVFDGRPLPAKKGTNDERKQRRSDNMRAGALLMTQGRKEEAIQKFQQAVTITPEIVEATIEFFRSFQRVDILVAPYESDAQLAFLTKEGFADAVITEDSDLIAFGCEKIIFKWNAEKGDCIVYEKTLLPSCFTGDLRNKFDFTKFRRVCILSGCDYLQNGLPGIGLTKAMKFFNKTCQTDLRTLLPRIPSYLQDTKLKVSKAFIDEFIRAENTFLYQIVFDPRQRCQRPLNPYPLSDNKEITEVFIVDESEDFIKTSQAADDSDSEYHYAGVVSTTTMSLRLALGNQTTGSQIADKFLLPSNIPEWSVWGNVFESGGKKITRKEAEEHKKLTSCGAFKLDSPQRIKKRVHDENTDFGDITAKTPTPKKARGRPKKLKNEPIINESYEELMRIYGPEKSSSTDSKKTDITLNIEKLAPTIKEVVTVDLSQESSSATSDFSLPPGYITPNVTPKQSQEKTENSESSKKPKEEAKAIVAPALVKSATLPCSLTKKSLGSGKPVLTKSPYFTNKSCSNPFKKVVFDSPATGPLASSSSVVKSDEKQKSLLSDVDEADSKPSQSYLINRFAGFKPAGLRRSFTK